MHPCLVGYAAIVVIAMAVALVHSTIGLTASEWAAWVQAIGSIATIGAGAWFINYQSQLARSKRRRALLAMLTVATKMLAKEGAIPENDLEAGCQMVGINLNRLAYVRGALSTVPLHDLESADHVALVEEAVEILRAAERHVEGLGGPITGDRVIAGIGKAYREKYMRLLEIKALIQAHV